MHIVDALEKRVAELEALPREILRIHDQTPQTQWIVEAARKLLDVKETDLREPGDE